MTFRHERRLIALAATVALHLCLFIAWRSAPQVEPRQDGPRVAIQWVNIEPGQQPQALPRKPPREKRAITTRRTREPLAPQAISAMPSTRPPPLIAAQPGDSSAAPAVSADSILQQAKRDLGALDKEVRKEFALRGLRAKIDTPEIRLQRGMQAAHDAVPPKWYEGARIREVLDPGQSGRKRYRVVTGSGTYCVTVDSHYSPGAQLDAGKRVEPRMTNCPPHEEGATIQEWE